MMSQASGEGKEPGQPGPSVSYGDVLEGMGLGEKEEKPFWAKFLKSDYLKEDDGPILGKVMEVLDGDKKVDEIIMNDQNKSAL